jgi:hypothetical protein
MISLNLIQQLLNRYVRLLFTITLESLLDAMHTLKRTVRADCPSFFV